MNAQPKPRCADCMAFSPLASGLYGECRRRSPTLDSDVTWPHVERSAWCMEFVPAPIEPRRRGK